MTILTREIFEKGMSSNGYWSKKQLSLFGLDYHNLRKGWKKTIIGYVFPKETIAEFLNLKDKHLKIPLSQMSLSL